MRVLVVLRKVSQVRQSWRDYVVRNNISTVNLAVFYELPIFGNGLDRLYDSGWWVEIRVYVIVISHSGLGHMT